MVAPTPIPGLTLGISPSSSASASTGLDMLGDHGGGMTGDVSIGGGAESWFSGVIRDLAIGVAVALLAKWAWGKIR